MTPEQLAYKLAGYPDGKSPEKIDAFDAIILTGIDKDIELIQQAKKEWCKKQREICALIAPQYDNNDGKNIGIILNAPEP